MKVKLSILAAAALAATFGLSGCGGNEDPSEVTLSGVAVDGYVANADICVDTDNNEATCEWSGKTNGKGEYSIPGAYAHGKIIISGGIDLDTNASFKGVLKAPAGSKVASPLTTLLADGMKPSTLKSALGLPANTDLTKNFRADGSFDPEVARAALKVQALMGTLVEAIAAKNPSLTKAQIAAMVTGSSSTFVVQMLYGIRDNYSGQTALFAFVTSKQFGNTISYSEATAISNTIFSTLTAIQGMTLTEQNVAMAVQTVSNAVPLMNGAYAAGNRVSIADVNSTFDQKGVVAPVTVAASSAMSSMSLGVTLKNKEGITTTAKTIDLGIVIDDTASTRELRAIIKGVSIALDSTGKIVVSVPADAKLYIQGTTSTGIAAGAMITNAQMDQVISDTNGVISVDLNALLARIANKVTTSISFPSLSEAGSYNVSFYLSGLTMGYEDATNGVVMLNAPSETLKVTVNSAVISEMTGTKLSGNITVQ